jgi:hypothetical protein
MGDPSTVVDSALAFLAVPEWGGAMVLARYYTNADRDSGGRASMVYDVVALDAASLAAVRGDPFRAFPALPPDRRPERRGELPVPAVAAATAEDDARRRAELLARLGAASPLEMVLAALLGGERVLWLAHAEQEALLEALVLMLPMPLRLALTFQTETVEYPKHAPRLTMAVEQRATLRDKPWTSVIPRDAARIPAPAQRAAAALLALAAQAPARLARAHALYERYEAAAGVPAGASLGTEVERLLRLADLRAALDRDDRSSLAEGMLVLARATERAEEQLIAGELLAHAPPDVVAEAMVAMLARGGGRPEAWEASLRLALAVARRRDGADRERFQRFFGAVLEPLGEVAWPTTPPARTLRALLASVAVAFGDLTALVAYAAADLDWSAAPVLAGQSPQPGQPTPHLRQVFEGLLGMQRPTSQAGIRAITALSNALDASRREPWRARVAALALDVARRVMRERPASESLSHLRHLVDALVALWGRVPEAVDEAQMLRHLLGVYWAGEEPAAPGRIADAAAHLIDTTLPPGAHPEAAVTETVAWAAAALQRVQEGAAGDDALEAVATLLDREARGPDAARELRRRFGAALGELTAEDRARLLLPEWLRLLDAVEPQAQRELLLAALAQVLQDCAGGRLTVGDVTDACAALGARGIVLDAHAARPLLPALRALREDRWPGRMDTAALQVRLVVASLGEIADGPAMAAMADELLAAAPGAESRAPGPWPHPPASGGHPPGPRALGAARLRRAGAALAEVERLRLPERLPELKRLYEQAGAGTMPNDLEEALRRFLGVSTGGRGAAGRRLGAAVLGARRPGEQRS